MKMNEFEQALKAEKKIEILMEKEVQGSEDE